MAVTYIDRGMFDISISRGHVQATCLGCEAQPPTSDTVQEAREWCSRHMEVCGCQTLGFAELANGEIVAE